MTLMNEIALEIVRNNIPCVFLSPHLDDAVYSAGSLLAYLAGKTSVVVVTAFTKASHPPYSPFASRYMKQCGYTSAIKLFTDRRREDILVMSTLGVSFRHLGFTDAAWRRTADVSQPHGVNRTKSFFSAFRYPNTVFPRKYHALDELMIPQLHKTIVRSIDFKVPYIVFGPIAFGHHVDHILIREVCRRYFPNTIYWTDYPYGVRAVADVRLNDLETVYWKSTQFENVKKQSLIKKYKTQFSALFPIGTTPVYRERYFVGGEIHNTDGFLI